MISAPGYVHGRPERADRRAQRYRVEPPESPAGPPYAGRSQIEDEAYGLVDRVDLLDARYPAPGNDSFGGYDPKLVTARIRRVLQSAASRCQLDVAAKPVGSRPDRHDDNETALAVVEYIGGDHDGRPGKRRLVTDGSPEIDVVDLASPDQLMESHS